jgi:hypothetical protein
VLLCQYDGARRCKMMTEQKHGQDLTADWAPGRHVDVDFGVAVEGVGYSVVTDGAGTLHIDTGTPVYIYSIEPDGSLRIGTGGQSC